MTNEVMQLAIIASTMAAVIGALSLACRQSPSAIPVPVRRAVYRRSAQGPRG